MISLLRRWFLPGVLMWGTAACDVGAALPLFSPCEEPAVPLAESDSMPAVATTAAGEFVLAGEKLVPHGVNSYPLLQHVGEGNLTAVRDILAQSRDLGRPYLRTNAFMDGGDHPARIRDHQGNIREAGLRALDRVVAEAADASVALILVLTNNWEDYGGAGAVLEMVAPGEGLPKDAFWSEPRAIAAQRAYIETIVTRENHLTGVVYGDDPAIFAFELANEARCNDGKWCDANTLPKWAAVMSKAVRDAGARQLVFWGGEGGRGENGEDLTRIAIDGGVDVLTLHLYLTWSHGFLYQFDTAERIGAAIRVGADIIEDRARLARSFGLPLVLEEYGWRPGQGMDAAQADWERVQVTQGWLAVAHERGVATLPWMIGESGREDYDGFLIRPDDADLWRVISCGRR